MLSSHPTSVKCDIEKGFITCSTTLTAACSFGVNVWVYSLISSPFPYIYVCLTNKKKILNIVESSHIGKVWYWEGVYHLLRNTNYIK